MKTGRACLFLLFFPCLFNLFLSNSTFYILPSLCDCPFTGSLLSYIPLTSLFLPAPCSNYYLEHVDSHYDQRMCSTPNKWHQRRQIEGVRATVPPIWPIVDTAHPPKHSFPLNPQCSQQLFQSPKSETCSQTGSLCSHLHSLDSIGWNVKYTSKQLTGQKRNTDGLEG